jgi:hypothetical protein
VKAADDVPFPKRCFGVWFIWNVGVTRRQDQIPADQGERGDVASWGSI